MLYKYLLNKLDGLLLCSLKEVFNVVQFMSHFPYDECIYVLFKKIFTFPQDDETPWQHSISDLSYVNLTGHIYSSSTAFSVWSEVGS